MSRPRRIKGLHRRGQGMTLIELMLAVVILSMGLTMVLRSFLVIIDSMQRTENIILAAQLLEEKMEDVKREAALNGGIVRGTVAGQFPPAGSKVFTWNLSAVPSGISEDLAEAQLAVVWQERQKPRTLTAVTYLQSRDK